MLLLGVRGGGVLYFLGGGGSVVVMHTGLEMEGAFDGLVLMNSDSCALACTSCACVGSVYYSGLRVTDMGLSGQAV